MTVEILFGELCNLYGDAQNSAYLKKCLPDAAFIETPITDKPYFADNKPDMILLGSMSEKTQRAVIEKLMPLKDRIEELISAGTVFLATGNAYEVFTKHIDYVTEKKSAEGLGLFNLTVKTDLFDRYNGKVLGSFDNQTLTGFRSQFSMVYGDNSQFGFLNVKRGIGINKKSRLEGVRRNNFIGTALLGPVLPLNPLFCEYLIGLTGVKAEAAFKKEALAAYEQRLKEFSDPGIKF